MKKVFASKGVVLFYILSMAFSYFAVVRIDSVDNSITDPNTVVINDLEK